MRKIYALLCSILILAGFVRIAEAQVYVTGAGSPYNETFNHTWNNSGKPAYEMSVMPTTYIFWSGSEWRMTDGTGSVVYYTNNANTATPPNVGWVVGAGGTAPAPVMSGETTSIIVGDGTSGNPYQIANLNSLYWIAQNTSLWNKYFEQTANIDASETATWFGGEGWTPIGNWPNHFTGSYQGNNHTIDALTINRNSDNQGLFGHVRSTGGIYNLALTNVDITGTELVGALSGAVDGGATVYNCYSSGTITTTGMGYCGGLIGNADNATVNSNSSECTVTSPGGYHVGGLVGLAGASIIENCWSSGSVTGDYAVGGLVGNVDEASEVHNSYCLGNVTGTGSGTGGLIGYLQSNSIVTGSYSTGSVSGMISTGGLVGYMHQGTISDCYCRSVVTFDITKWDGGGLLGCSESGTIEKCYSTGSVTGGSNIGGLIGRIWETTVNASFWDTQTSGVATSAGGTGKTTAEMKLNTTFLSAGWSGATWFIGDGHNNDYPYLAWENPSGTPMPVELTSFTAAVKSRGVELSWSTATETNNYGFEIEKRMKDELGIMNWRKIGFVEGHGTTNAPKRYSFVDGSANGTVVYRLKQIDRDGSFEYSNQVEVTVAAPAEFALMQNHPNPFNPATAINYTLPVAGHVSLKVYDMLGKEVATLVNAVQDAGAKIIQYDASQLPSGIYFYTLRTNNFTATKKMLLVK